MANANEISPSVFNEETPEQRQAGGGSDIDIPAQLEKLHPIIVGVFHNTATGAYDLDINVGNFETLEDAKQAAISLKGIFSKEFPHSPPAQIEGE